MGRGDNRKSMKMRRRKSWRRLKARIARKIAEGKSRPKPAKTGSSSAAAEAPQAVRRDGES